LNRGLSGNLAANLAFGFDGTRSPMEYKQYNGTVI
jgi:hypothetical protein